jgi:hypothetical protein
MSVFVCVCQRLSIFCSLLLVVLRALRVLRGCNLNPLVRSPRPRVVPMLYAQFQKIVLFDPNVGIMKTFTR